MSGTQTGAPPTEEERRRFLQDWPNIAGFEGLKEERGPIELPVSGAIPAWAAGSLFRIGPGPSQVEGTPKGTHRISHWFDGLGHAHKFEIIADDDGKVRVMYSSRRQSDTLVNYIKKHGTSGLLSFGQKRDPCIGLFGKMMVTFKTATSFDRAKQVKKGLENVSVTVMSDPPVHVENLSKTSRASFVGGSADTAIATANAATASATAGSSSGHKAEKPLWMLTDTSTISKVDPNTLEPLGLAMQEQLHPDLVGPLSCAHATRDPLTGDVYNFNLDFGPTPTYRIFCIRAATGKTEILAKFGHSSIKAIYTHSFFLTERYVVLCLAGARIGLKGASILLKGNVMDAIEPFDPKHKTKWLFIDRTAAKRGIVALHETDASFFFHSVNAFEGVVKDGEGEGGEELGFDTINCDLVEYANFDILRSLYFDALTNRDGAGDKFWSDETSRKNALPSLTRYSFRVPSAASAGAGNSTVVTGNNQGASISGKFNPANIHQGAGLKLLSIRSPSCGELPTINPAYATKRSRYVYGMSTRLYSTLNDTVIKTDMDTGEALFWANQPHGHTPGEAIFVARPGATEEDDGCLLSVVLDGHLERSYLLCLDARTMVEMGRAECGFPIGFGFHGQHVGKTGGSGDGVTAAPGSAPDE